MRRWGGNAFVKKEPCHCSTSIASSDDPGPGKKPARSSGGGDVGGDGRASSGRGANDDGSNPANSTSPRAAGSGPPRNNACNTARGSFGASSTLTPSSSSDDASKSVTTIPAAQRHVSGVLRCKNVTSHTHCLSRARTTTTSAF